jgi:pilus assembly protein CpaB
MGRRTILLVSAFLVAALGTSLVFLYARKADDRALKDQQQVEVLVAKSDIAAGTTATAAAAAGAFELRTVARSSVVSTAVSSIDAVRDKVALSTIFTGQQVLSVQFGDPSASQVLPIPDGKIAVSIQLGDPARVAGFVEPGSNVAVFVTLASQGSALPQTRLLLPAALVIAVGPTSLTPANADGTGANKEALPRAILTLALDQRNAEKLVFASQQGQVFFGLRNDKSKVAPGPGVTIGNLFS